MSHSLRHVASNGWDGDARRSALGSALEISTCARGRWEAGQGGSLNKRLLNPGALKQRCSSRLVLSWGEGTRPLYPTLTSHWVQAAPGRGCHLERGDSAAEALPAQGWHLRLFAHSACSGWRASWAACHVTHSVLNPGLQFLSWDELAESPPLYFPCWFKHPQT